MYIFNPSLAYYNVTSDDDDEAEESFSANKLEN